MPTCIFEGCDKRAYYGLRGTVQRLYCYEHRNPSIHIGLDRSYCISENCNLVASFGLPHTTKRLYCDSHKDEKIHVNLIYKKEVKKVCNIRFKNIN